MAVYSENEYKVISKKTKNVIFYTTKYRHEEIVELLIQQSRQNTNKETMAAIIKTLLVLALTVSIYIYLIIHVSNVLANACSTEMCIATCTCIGNRL